jgi:hypothetical protein
MITTLKTTLALLAATTAFGAITTIPAIAADRTADVKSPRAVFSASADIPLDGMVLSASGDDEDDDEKDDDDCEDDDEDEGGCAAGSNPAPAGTVAPPANGLFGNGAAPRVQVN